jgi:hypothetical protein
MSVCKPHLWRTGHFRRRACITPTIMQTFKNITVADSEPLIQQMCLRDVVDPSTNDI